MKRFSWIRNMAFALVAIGFVVIISAWQQQPVATKSKLENKDTVPKKPRNIDEVLEQLEQGRVDLEKTINNREWEKEMQAALKEIDLSKIQAQVELALKEVDMAKIQADVQASIAKIDMEKISKEIEASLKDVDMEKIKAEVALALKDVNAAKIQADVQASLSKIDAEKIKAEMAKVREIDFKKMEEEMKKMGPQIERSMEAARESLATAKKEITGYKTLIDGLSKDGLLDQSKPYTIEYKNGELSINGKKQSAATVSKYNNILKDHDAFTIKKDADSFDIDKD